MMHKRLERDLGLSAGRAEKQISLAHPDIVCILERYTEAVQSLFRRTQSSVGGESQ